jgi:hypothetical protein
MISGIATNREEVQQKKGMTAATYYSSNIGGRFSRDRNKLDR